MRFAYPLFMLVLLALIVSSWFSFNVYSDPKLTAVNFMQAVGQGDLVKAVKLFGSNACRCPAKGGWVSYLIYKSGQEQNMAFLVGHPFQLGAPSVIPMLNKKKALLPWQKPEDCAVDLPIKFDDKIYMPYFLPLKMAYGKDMTEKEFNEFLRDPDKEAVKGFTLRLRPSLAAGAIAPPMVKVPPDLTSEFIALRTTNSQATVASKSASSSGERTVSGITEEDIKAALGPDATAYLTPRDPGKVLINEKQAMPIEEIATKLPRLRSAVARLHVVRRGKLNNWTVYHVAVLFPTMRLNNGREVKLLQHLGPE